MKIKSPLFIKLYFLFVCMLLAVMSNAQKPNIIIVMADDLDSRQLSCYGGKNIVTKNIDALAAQGMKFNQMITSAIKRGVPILQKCGIPANREGQPTLYRSSGF